MERRAMTEEEQLDAVKKGLNITGDYQNDAVLHHMREVKCYLSGGGVSDDILASSEAIGILTIGVSDLYNGAPGNSQLSTYFKERAAQLVYRSRREGA